MSLKKILFQITILFGIGIGQTQAVLVQQGTNRPETSKVSKVLQESYKKQILAKKEEIQKLEKSKDPKATDKIKQLKEDISALEITLKNVDQEVSKRLSTLKKAETPLVGPHASLAKMSQFEAVGSLRNESDNNDEFSSCTATLIGETNNKKFWVGVTAAHCVNAEGSKRDKKQLLNQKENKESLSSKLSFCPKEMTSHMKGAQHTSVCEEEDWIPVTAVSMNPTYATNDTYDIALFMIPKTDKEFKTPQVVSQEEIQTLRNTIETHGMEAWGVGYGATGDAVKELKEEFAQKKADFSSFEILFNFGHGYNQGKVDAFKSAYTINVMGQKNASQSLGLPRAISEFYLIGLSEPIQGNKGKLSSDEDKLFAGSLRRGDSGGPLFVRTPEGHLLLIGIAAVDASFILFEPANKRQKSEMFQEFKDLDQNEISACAQGKAKCSVVFAGGYTSLLNKKIFQWFTNEWNDMKAGPESFSKQKQSDPNAIYKIYQISESAHKSIPKKGEKTKESEEDSTGEYTVGSKDHVEALVEHANNFLHEMNPQNSGNKESLNNIFENFKYMNEFISDIKSFQPTKNVPTLPQVPSVKTIQIPTETLNKIQQEVLHLNEVLTQAIKKKLIPPISLLKEVPKNLAGNAQALNTKMQTLEKDIKSLPPYLFGEYKETNDLSEAKKNIINGIDVMNENIDYLNTPFIQENLKVLQEDLKELEDLLKEF